MIKPLITTPLKRLGHYAVYQSIALPFAVLFIALALIVSPVGEFPLSDDWIYAKTVQHLLATGQYKAHPYINATLVAQSYWGALFCKIWGFSFTTLRVSTLVLAFVNAWAIAKSGLILGFSRNLALLCGAMVATSPLVLQLSYSFMTDVPFFALSNLSGFFFLKALRYPKPQFAAWGSIAAALAFLVRQFGLLLPLAFLITIAVLGWRRRYVCTRPILVAVLMPWVVVVGIYAIWGDALASETPIIELSKSYAGPILNGIRHIPVALCYMGLFTLPLGISRGVQMIQSKRSGGKIWSARQWSIFMGFCGCSVLAFWLPQILYWVRKLVFHHDAQWLHNYPYRMPLIRYRTLLDLGLGPLQLPDSQFQPTVHVGEWWWLVTLAALFVSGLLFMAIANQWGAQPDCAHERNVVQQNQDLFLVSWALLALAATYNPFRVIMVDRYLLVAFVPFVLLLGRELMQGKPALSFRPILISTIAIALFSILSLQEYLAWNHTAWAAHQQLEVKYHADPQVVKGIDTFNGWFNSEAYMQRHNTRSWWDVGKGGSSPWALDDQYVVASTEPRPGYEVLERFPYFSWLGWQERTIIIFKRLSAEVKN